MACTNSQFIGWTEKRCCGRFAICRDHSVAKQRETIKTKCWREEKEGSSAHTMKSRVFGLSLRAQCFQNWFVLGQWSVLSQSGPDWEESRVTRTGPVGPAEYAYSGAKESVRARATAAVRLRNDEEKKNHGNALVYNARPTNLTEPDHRLVCNSIFKNKSDWNITNEEMANDAEQNISPFDQHGLDEIVEPCGVECCTFLCVQNRN